VLVATLTLLFTDIEGATALLQRLGESAYEQTLADHHALIRSALTRHDGREVDNAGDGFFAVFSSPLDCVAAVLEIQHALQAESSPGAERVRVRMGLHTGDASAQPDVGFVGLDVHRAARIAAVAHGGQVVLSETAALLVRDALPASSTLTDLGVHRLKDLGRPERIFQLGAPGLRADFPPLRSLGNPALLNNLPAQLAPFIGRDRELAEVRALLDTSRLVTLTGAGGAGKTRLGLQAAAELLDGSGDGVWLVELAAVTGDDAVAAAVCTALRISAQPGRLPGQALADALSLQSTLIVLDNCEHLIRGCAKVANALMQDCPRVHLLATSREPLGISGETIYRVPPLSLPGPEADDESGQPESFDAVALFAARARAQGIDLVVDQQTGPLVVSVCRRLDGLPLAIELAAARLRSLSLSELHDRLDHRFRLLTGGSRTALERQQTLSAAVGWSYSLLTGPERALLRRLSVFADGFTVAAAEAVCGFGDIDVLDVVDLLGSLVDKSLVLAEHSGSRLRYRLLETIRQFAAEQLAVTSPEGEAAAVGAAHCAHFLALAEAAAPHLTGPDQVSWATQLDIDRANLRRAGAHAASQADGTALVLRFGVALERFWPVHSREEETAAAALLLPVLERPDADADDRLFAAALITGSELCLAVDAPSRGLRFAGQAVQVARRLNDDRLTIKSLGRAAVAYWKSGQAEAGRPFGLEAVERARQLGDDVLLAESLLAYLGTGPVAHDDQEQELYAEVIACTQRSGDLVMTMTAHNNAGLVALLLGHIRAARAHLDEAVRVMQALPGDQDPLLIVNRAWVLMEQQDPAAPSAFEAGLRMSRRSGRRLPMAYAILGLACLEADIANWEKAAELHGAAEALLHQPWTLIPDARRGESLDKVRSAIGDERFDQAFSQGMARTVAQAIDLALSR